MKRIMLAVVISLGVFFFCSAVSTLAATYAATEASSLTITVERYENSNTMTLHLNRQIISTSSISYAESPRNEMRKWENAELAKNLFKIDGITGVTFRDRYILSLSKGICFNWDDIQEKVMPLILEYFGTKETKITRIPTVKMNASASSNASANSSSDARTDRIGNDSNDNRQK